MDIVDGLRLVAGAPTDRLDCFNCHSRMREAADEITRLRAELERSRDELADSEASMLRRFDPAAADSTDLFTWITCLRAELAAELQRRYDGNEIASREYAEQGRELERLRAELAECRKELARVPMLLRHYADSTNGQRAIAAQKLAAFFDQRYAALAAKGE